jgi:hypothetical protein
MLLLVLYFLAILPFATPLSSSTTKHKIHKRMSINDLRNVFQVESHNDVPEYDLTNIRVINKRSIDQESDQNGLSPKQIHLKAFGKKVKLNLQQNNDFNDRIKNMKVFMAETTSNGKLRYSEAPTSSEKNNLGTTYHDKSNMAAILVDHNSDGSIQLHGTIGNDLVIRPVPSSLRPQNNEYLRHNDDDDDEMFLDEDEAIESAKKFKTQPDNTNSTTNSNTATFVSQLPTSSNSKLSKTATNSDNRGNTHVIYKRNMFNPESHSDYCKF